MPWLQPLPDALLAAEHDDPAAVAASRAGIRLALVAALQYLSARQRAVLILRDVLEWPAAEVADLLGTTTTAVNSMLRRARAQLAQALPAEDEVAEPAEPGRRALLDRFAAAFENADVSALAELLREDVALEMPPVPTWFAGREAVTRFLASHVLTAPGRLRMVPTWPTASRRSRPTSAAPTAPTRRTPCWCPPSPRPGSPGWSSSSTPTCSARSACREYAPPGRAGRRRPPVAVAG